MNALLLVAAIGLGLALYLLLVAGVARVLAWLRDDIEHDAWDQATHVRLHQVLDDRAGDR